MLSSSRNFGKTSLGLRMLSTFFGKGLLAVQGATHKLHRKVALPAFTTKAVEELSPIV
jgi:cytochrome P450